MNKPEELHPNFLFKRNLKMLFGIFVVFLGIYFFFIRPWHTKWNCGPEDIQRVMAGDEGVANPTFVTNRAILIEASPEAIWPWLVQLGEGRGGFYSYDWIDHLLGFDINSADRILPQFQQPLKVGGVIPRGMHIWKVSANQCLVVGTPPEFPVFQTTWALVLIPVDKGRTKLISRVRAHYDDWRFSNLFMAAVLDPGQFIMEQKMLWTLKKLVEKNNRPPRSGA